MKNICLAFALLMFVGNISAVYAQEVVTSVNPSFQHVYSKPGKTIYTNLTFTTQGDPQVFTLKIYALSDPDEEGGFTIGTTNPSGITIRSNDPYIRLDEPFLSPSRREETIPLRIDIPDTVPDGEYAFLIASESQQQPLRQGTVTSKIEGGAGSIIFVTVTKTGVDIKDVQPVLFEAVPDYIFSFFSSKLKIANSGSAIPISFFIRNSGTYNVIPNGELRIKNTVTGKEDIQQLVPVYIYPATTRLMKATGFDSELCTESFSTYQCAQDYTYIVQAPLFGFYHISSVVQYGENAPVQYTSDYVAVLPVYPLIGILIALTAVVGFVIYEWRKHRNQPHTPHVTRRVIHK